MSSPVVDRKDVCVVAGVGPGVGLAVARRFGQAGFHVALVARDAVRLSGFVEELNAIGIDSSAFVADLGDPQAVRSTLNQIAEESGNLRVLVYNAAVWIESPSVKVSAEDFNRQLSVSVTGALVAAQTVHPYMKSAGAGTILFTGGGLALRPEYGRGVAALTAGKSALRGLTYAIAGEFAEDGIHLATVTIAGMVAPGTPFDPDRIAQSFWDLHNEPSGQWSVETVFTGQIKQ